MFWWGLPVFSKGRCYPLIHLAGQVNLSDGFVYHMHIEAHNWYFMVLVGEPKAPAKFGWLFCCCCCCCCCQSVSRVRLFNPCLAKARQASLSFTICQSLLRLMSTELMMPSNHLILFSPDLNLSQHQSLFQWVGSSHQVAKVLELQLQHQSFQWIFRVDFL